MAQNRSSFIGRGLILTNFSTSVKAIYYFILAILFQLKRKLIMKKLLILALCVAWGSVQAQTQTVANHGTVTLVVNIKNFKSDDGMAYITLQDPTNKAVQKTAVKISNNATQVVFKNLVLGKYAVRLYHDKNDNKVMDKGIFGLPKESWGVSNDVKARFGPPKFEDTLFVVDRDKTISITMN